MRAIHFAGGVCVSSPHDRCPLGVRLWSLSEVNLDLPPGSVPECFKVAVGTTPGLENVAKIGIDVLVDFVVCLVQLTLLAVGQKQIVHVNIHAVEAGHSIQVLLGLESQPVYCSLTSCRVQSAVAFQNMNPILSIVCWKET
jgi:hypothetical protein